MTAAILNLFACTLSLASPQSPEVIESPFPESSALAEGLSPSSLASLGALVQGFVDDEEIVGAELLVIKNGRTVLHDAYGWRNRELEEPMQNGSVFCVRSMTKPFIAASIQMLIESKQIKYSDSIAKYLPAFDVDGFRELTVEQLLTHTSGLSMSKIMSSNPRELESIQAVAALGATGELEFSPGTSFNYSDQGTDTLTAVVEVVSGMPVEDFVRTRLLEPLGMADSTCLMTQEHPLRERGCVKYVGSPGAWTPFWTPQDEALFPIFLGSQALYSTLEDYARFTDMWKRKGRAGKQRLLKSRSVRRTLTPGPHPMNGPTGLPGLSTAYGYLMQLWTAPGEPQENGEAGKPEVVAFGHTGSDGTHAWVFPEQDAMVFYFTQSRGTSTGLRVEEALGDLLLGVPFDANQMAPPFDEYLGFYWEGEDDLYRAIVRDGDDLALEVIGKGVVPLSYIGEDRWKLRPSPSNVIQFDRSESGAVSGYHIGDHQEFRVESTRPLPSAEEIAIGILEAHHIERLAAAGGVRFSGTITIEKQGIEGTMNSLLAWPDRFRVDSKTADTFEQSAFDGQKVWSASTLKELGQLEGAEAEAVLSESPFLRYGNWSELYPDLQVIQKMTKGSRQAYIVRSGGTDAPAITMYVDIESGRLVGEDSVNTIAGLGRIGRRLRFGDHQDVAGVLFPFQVELELANPMIGKIVSKVIDFELDVELPEGVFRLVD